MNEGVVTADALCEPPGSARMKLKTLPLPERPLYPTTFPRHRRTTVFFRPLSVHALPRPGAVSSRAVLIESLERSQSPVPGPCSLLCVLRF